MKRGLAAAVLALLLALWLGERGSTKALPASAAAAGSTLASAKPAPVVPTREPAPALPSTEQRPAPEPSKHEPAGPHPKFTDAVSALPLRAPIAFQHPWAKGVIHDRVDIWLHFEALDAKSQLALQDRTPADPNGAPLERFEGGVRLKENPGEEVQVVWVSEERGFLARGPTLSLESQPERGMVRAIFIKPEPERPRVWASAPLE